jgi:hypothetical protein
LTTEDLDGLDERGISSNKVCLLGDQKLELCSAQFNFVTQGEINALPHIMLQSVSRLDAEKPDLLELTEFTPGCFNYVGMRRFSNWPALK